MAEVAPKYAENPDLLAHGQRIADELRARGYDVDSHIVALNSGLLVLMARRLKGSTLALVCAAGRDATADLFERKIVEAGG